MLRTMMLISLINLKYLKFEKSKNSTVWLTSSERSGNIRCDSNQQLRHQWGFPSISSVCVMLNEVPSNYEMKHLA